MIGASAAVVVCLGAALAACGGGSREGYVATGAVGGPQAAVTVSAPSGKVTLVPLDGPGTRRTGRAVVGNSPGGGGRSADAADSASPRLAPGGEDGTVGGGAPSRGAAESGPTSAPSASASPTPGGTAAGGPALLSWGGPSRTATDRRWCEDVRLVFTNSGGSPVRSGAVTFGTHVIGALGVDWATVESTVGLPAPIGAGARRQKTWTVCVDAWRVPLGMHIETRDVSVRWK